MDSPIGFDRWFRRARNLLFGSDFKDYEAGWKDLIGDVNPKSQGAGRPTLGTFRGDIRWFHYTAGDDGDIVFHMPHDWCPGTDLFLHVHWAHNGTNISGTFDMRTHVTFAKGFQQGDDSEFLADVEPHIVVNDLSIANTPQYQHRVDEIQLSIKGGSATQLDTDRLEVDGLILVHFDMDAIPSITGGTGEPFIFALDIHYQTDRVATAGKAPNFYTS